MLVFRFRRRTLRWLAVATALLLTVVIALLLGGGVNHTLTAVSRLVSLKPIYSVDTDAKTLAISFDATWGAEYTKEILDILDENDIKTTFFLVNIWMEEYPELTKEIVARGHEIGLHSATHPSFLAISEEQMRTELEQNSAMITELTGTAPTLFRPPYGDYSDTVLSLAETMGYKVIQWSVDSLDWQGISAAEIERRVLDGAANGAIILLHNNGEYTAAALRSFLPQLKSQGYDIVPVSRLVYSDSYYIDYNGVQHIQSPSTADNQ